jgi:hypothetical protein
MILIGFLESLPLICVEFPYRSPGRLGNWRMGWVEEPKNPPGLEQIMVQSARHLFFGCWGLSGDFSRDPVTTPLNFICVKLLDSVASDTELQISISEKIRRHTTLPFASFAAAGARAQGVRNFTVTAFESDATHVSFAAGGLELALPTTGTTLIVRQPRSRRVRADHAALRTRAPAAGGRDDAQPLNHATRTSRSGCAAPLRWRGPRRRSARR